LLLPLERQRGELRRPRPDFCAAEEQASISSIELRRRRDGADADAD
jgi:hypothetical protein